MPLNGVVWDFVKDWYRRYAERLGVAAAVAVASPILYAWALPGHFEWAVELAKSWTALCFYVALLPTLIKGQQFGTAGAWLFGCVTPVLDLCGAIPSSVMLAYSAILILVAPSVLIRWEVKRDFPNESPRSLPEIGLFYLLWMMIWHVCSWLLKGLLYRVPVLIIWTGPVRILRETGQLDEADHLKSVASFWGHVLAIIVVAVILYLLVRMLMVAP